MNKSIGNAVKLVIFVISLSLVSSSFAGPARPLMVGDLTDSPKKGKSSSDAPLINPFTNTPVPYPTKCRETFKKGSRQPEKNYYKTKIGSWGLFN